jgi:hypothetical protein
MVCEPAATKRIKRGALAGHEVDDGGVMMDRYLSEIVREKHDAMREAARHWFAAALRLLQHRD